MTDLVALAISRSGATKRKSWQKRLSKLGVLVSAVRFFAVLIFPTAMREQAMNAVGKEAVL
jgi:hypothetical protein